MLASAELVGLDHVASFIVSANHSVKYLEIIADNLSKAGLELGLRVSSGF